MTRNRATTILLEEHLGLWLVFQVYMLFTHVFQLAQQTVERLPGEAVAVERPYLL